MKARITQPFDRRSFDNTAINLAIFLITLHDLLGFGQQRCGQTLTAFYQRREAFNRTAEKEGKFTAECYLKKRLGESRRG